jgi:hypothetical protein
MNRQGGEEKKQGRNKGGKNRDEQIIGLGGRRKATE